jgi:hypothetical protein
MWDLRERAALFAKEAELYYVWLCLMERKHKASFKTATALATPGNL